MTEGAAKPGAAMNDRFTARPDDAEIERIETERAERLDPANRPDDAEVDNTHRDFDSEAGMFTDDPGYEKLSPDDKPYDDDAGEMKAPEADETTETAETAGAEQPEEPGRRRSGPDA